MKGILGTYPYSIKESGGEVTVTFHPKTDKAKKKDAPLLTLRFTQTEFKKFEKIL